MSKKKNKNKDLEINLKEEKIILVGEESICGNEKIVEDNKKLDKETVENKEVKEEISKKNKVKFYDSIEQLSADLDFLPEWVNGQTPLNEVNMNRLNNEIRQKFDGAVLDNNKRLILKTDGLNRIIIDLKIISENNYSNAEKAKVAKIDDIENRLNTLSLDFGTF